MEAENRQRVTGVHVYRPKKRGRKDSAKEAMDGILQKIGYDPLKYALFAYWQEETKGLIRNCEAVAIQKKVLCVRVPSPAHRQELIYAKKRIISRLNQRLGRDLVQDIRFELGSMNDNVQSVSNRNPQGGIFRGEDRRRNWSIRKRHG